jgi:hypothetical protein
LRKLLHDLRESFPQVDRFLKITPAYIQWNHELPFYSDVREFEQAANGRTLYELRTAEELYRGELLPGFYEEWLGAKREQLAQTYLNVLDKFISILESLREYSSALFIANKLLVHNKLREETYRTLMQLHALNIDKAGVMQIYQQLHNILQTELGIDPTDETKQLLEKLTQNGGEHSTAAYSSKPLIGRIGEWGNLQSAWKQAIVSGDALLILKGQAGIGKTRLALVRHMLGAMLLNFCENCIMVRAFEFRTKGLILCAYYAENQFCEFIGLTRNRLILPDPGKRNATTAFVYSIKCWCITD